MEKRGISESGMGNVRQERDSLGTVDVPEDRLWGAQTQRSLMNFRIGGHTIPKEIITALISIKQAAALANSELNVLDERKKELILRAIQSLTDKDIAQEFPLTVWQTGSGTQTNMNVNEVIANRANELAGNKRGSKSPIHPNDDVNKSQSSNDTFPTAMHIAFSVAIATRLIPALHTLHQALDEKAKAFYPIIKVGRTHMMDAVPIRLGQEFSGYAAQIEHAMSAIQSVMTRLLELALGGTAVGTGLNCPPGFKERAIRHLTAEYHLPFRPAENPFEALACHDTAVELSGTLKRTACALFKIANDIRIMASGPRCGISELLLPENEPGSSIMPGKINPTQCEAVTQVCCQVIGNDSAVTLASTQGHFELSTYKPVIAKNCLDSILLLADVSLNFTEKCLKGMRANESHINHLLEESLMLATALSQKIGYDKTAKITLLASHENITLKEAALRLGVPEDLFLEATDPTKMV
jgi:fumarate hydratase class II